MAEYLAILLRARLARRARMDERGASAVEYALLVVGVALVCLSGAMLMKLTIGSFFGAINSVLSSDAAAN